MLLVDLLVTAIVFTIAIVLVSTIEEHVSGFKDRSGL